MALSSSVAPRSAIEGSRSQFITGQKNVTTAGTPEQLPSVSVPDGFKVIIMAKPGNTGDIYLGNSATILSASQRFDKLEAGDSVPLQVTNTNLIWIDSSVNGEGICYIVEQ
jgi:hypothetical protein